jgi:hypothetical protein
MAREAFGRPRKSREEPLVSIRQGRFHFNSFFARIAELEKAKYVNYHIDDEIREIAFEFLRQDPEGNAYTLENRGGISKFRCTGYDLIRKKPWVQAAASAKDSKLYTFRATRDGKLWCIRLAPPFEKEVSRSDIGSIPPDVRGIYRYVSTDGEIVYIGKGNIRRRIAEQERCGWEFSKIQYSSVADDDQYQWEHFWIEHYRQTHSGRLPYFNRQGGNNT